MDDAAIVRRLCDTKPSRNHAVKWVNGMKHVLGCVGTPLESRGDILKCTFEIEKLVANGQHDGTHFVSGKETRTLWLPKEALAVATPWPVELRTPRNEEFGDDAAEDQDQVVPSGAQRGTATAAGEDDGK